MTLSLVVASVLVACGAAFWVFRAQEAFRSQLRDYEPAPVERGAWERALRGDGLRGGRRVEWALEDGAVQTAYYVPPRGGAMLIVAHGSPGNGLGMLDVGAAALVARGHGALLVDLPGYGASEGQRNWDARYVESLQRALDFVSAQPEVAEERIAGFGYSNGGNVIARAAAADDRMRGVILLATYTRLAEHLHHAFRRRTPGMGHLAVAAARWSEVPVEELDTLASLRRMGPRPTLILAGDQDPVIPSEMAGRLKSAVPGAEAIVFEGVGHIGFSALPGDVFVDAIDSFVARRMPPKGAFD